MSTSACVMLTDLPRDDVLMRHVMPFLSVRDLFRLRVTCSQLREAVDAYFCVMSRLDVSDVGSRFGSEQLSLVVGQSFLLKEALLSSTRGWLQSEHVICLIKNNTGLERLDVGGCSSLNNSVLQCLSTWCPGLRVLVLADCPWVSNQALLTLLEACRDLTHLEVANCWELTDATLTRAATVLTRLQSINLSGVYSVTDHTLTNLAHNCPKLRRVYLRSCWRITDSGIWCLAEYLKELTLLHVRDCRSVTEASLARLRPRGVLVDIASRPYELAPSYKQYLCKLKLQV